MCLIRLSRSRLFPFVVGYEFSFSAGILASGLEFMLHQVKAYWGHRMDFWWRLQFMASTPMTSIAPLKSCRFSSQFRVALVCLGQCTVPAGCVFPAAYRATTRFLLHTSTCTSAAWRLDCLRKGVDACLLEGVPMRTGHGPPS